LCAEYCGNHRKKDVTITPMSVIESPDILQDVRNYYAQIDRPHVLISLLTSVGKVRAANTLWPPATVLYLKKTRRGTRVDP
jgi:hypothetical protein